MKTRDIFTVKLPNGALEIKTFVKIFQFPSKQLHPGKHSMSSEAILKTTDSSTNFQHYDDDDDDDKDDNVDKDDVHIVFKILRNTVWSVMII